MRILRNPKHPKTLAACLACLLCISVWHEVVSLDVSSKGKYTGVVIDKTVSVGRSSTHYLYINWDGIGLDSIIVHPITYKRAEKGDKFSAEYAYLPLIGAVGGAYVPRTGDFGLAFGFIGFFSKLFFMAILWVGFLLKDEPQD